MLTFLLKMKNTKTTKNKDHFFTTFNKSENLTKIKSTKMRLVDKVVCNLVRFIKSESWVYKLFNMAYLYFLLFLAFILFYSHFDQLNNFVTPQMFEHAYDYINLSMKRLVKVFCWNVYAQNFHFFEYIFVQLHAWKLINLQRQQSWDKIVA